MGTSFLVVEMNDSMYSWTFCAVPVEIKLSTRTSMSKLWKGFPIPKYQMPTIVERAGFAISSDIDMAPRAK